MLRWLPAGATVGALVCHQVDPQAPGTVRTKQDGIDELGAAYIIQGTHPGAPSRPPNRPRLAPRQLTVSVDRPSPSDRIGPIPMQRRLIWRRRCLHIAHAATHPAPGSQGGSCLASRHGHGRRVSCPSRFDQSISGRASDELSVLHPLPPANHSCCFCSPRGPSGPNSSRSFRRRDWKLLAQRLGSRE